MLVALTVSRVALANLRPVCASMVILVLFRDHIHPHQSRFTFTFNTWNRRELAPFLGYGTLTFLLAFADIRCIR
jgi:hypothetical protein